MNEFGIFTNRVEAGLALAASVKALNIGDCVVIGLPRGGVPVAAQVARALDAPLDVIVVRKLGVPGQSEFGFGAISEDGVRVLNPEVVALVRLDELQIAEITELEQQSLENRVEQIRAIHPTVSIENRTVVIVDDGIATGIDAIAASRVARARGAKEVVLAVPVAPKNWRSRLSSEADRFVAVIEPENLMSVGQFYKDFSPVEDSEMLRYLNES